MKPPATATIGRHYGMDWLRIGAFALLILYHVGMGFVPWGWHVKTPEPWDWLVYPMLATNPWRLSLLFLVSGYASRALLSKPGQRPGAFLRRRTGRLLLPLLVGIVVIVAPQSWAEWRQKAGYPESFWTFWWQDYFDFKFAEGSIPMPTYNHLWFLLYLFAYTALLATVLMASSPAVRARAQRMFDRVLGRSWRWLLLPLAYLIACLVLVPEQGLPPQTFIGDWYRHAVYLGMFALGFGLAGSETVWDAIRSSWPLALALGIAAFGLAILLGYGPLQHLFEAPVQDAAFAVTQQVQAWGTIAGLIGFADRHWNRDARWRSYLALGVFPFYIIHQTIIVLVLLWTVEAGFSSGVQMAITLVATVLGCWLFYELVRRSGPLKPLFGLR